MSQTYGIVIRRENSCELKNKLLLLMGTSCTWSYLTRGRNLEYWSVFSSFLYNDTYYIHIPVGMHTFVRNKLFRHYHNFLIYLFKIIWVLHIFKSFWIIFSIIYWNRTFSCISWILSQTGNLSVWVRKRGNWCFLVQEITIILCKITNIFILNIISCLYNDEK